MTVKEFFYENYRINLEDSNSTDANMIKKECQIRGISCPSDKDITQLTDNEKYALAYLEYHKENQISLGTPVCSADVLDWWQKV